MTTSVLSSFPRRLEGKVALITGGASGIGEFTARIFIQHGAKVAIADIQDELGHTVAEGLGKSNCIYIHCNVTNEDDIRNAVDTTVATFGKLDIMFNNAGSSDPHKPRVIDNEKEDFERVLRINITGVFLGMKHAARVMVPARSGCIISSASINSSVGGTGSHAYCCSKHAVLGLTKNMAVELGQFGIRVNCISPFGIATPLTTNFFGLHGDGFEKAMYALGNLKGVSLKLEDIANAALYLASDEAKYVSGHNLFVDGGFTISNPASLLFRYPESEI